MKNMTCERKDFIFSYQKNTLKYNKIMLIFCFNYLCRPEYDCVIMKPAVLVLLNSYHILLSYNLLKCKFLS